MNELPPLIPFTWPCVPDALLTVATPVADDAHVAVVVRFCVELSLKVPVAVKFAVLPCGRFSVVGVTLIDVSEMPVPFSATVCVDPGVPPELSVTVICALLWVAAVKGLKPMSSMQLSPLPRVAGDIGQGWVASAV